MNTNVYENTDSETITPLNKRRILPVFLLVGLYAASTAAVMSVLPFYIREMGGSPLIIGIIIATEAFSQFCAAPLIGHLSDRVGRKRIMMAMSPRVRFILRPMKNTHRQHHLPLTPHVKRYRGVD